MLGAARAALLGAAAVSPPPALELLGSWPLAEAAGNTFADATGDNDAVLSRPAWAAIESAEWNRPGIVAGAGDHALEVSNHDLRIPLIEAYQQAAMSLVLYVEPKGQLRGTQYWDEADERFGREFLAFCDDGATPGGFALYRRLDTGWDKLASPATWSYRLGGYVRDGSGAKQYFGGGLAGIAGALLPIDTARRVVLTQGPAGAELWLDGTKVATLASVTAGWGSLAGNVAIGASSHQGHANDRSPLWGRIDEIRIYQGQLGQSEVEALPAAAASEPFRLPADFDLETAIDVAAYGTGVNALQGAIDAASSAGAWVYQAADNETWYPVQSSGGFALHWKPGCRGFLRVRLKRIDGEQTNFARMLNCGNINNGAMNAHGDPYAASGGYRFVGCKWDGNARGQDWHPKNNEPGFSHTGFDLEHSHAFFCRNTSQITTFTFDCCEFFDGSGDAIPHEENASLNVKSCRVYGFFRGGFVINNQAGPYLWLRNELFAHPVLRPVIYGCGIDVEPFGKSGSLRTLDCADLWMDNDFDDHSRGNTTDMRYYNTHCTNSGFNLIPANTASGSDNDPVRSWQAHCCTWTYHSHGGNGGGNFPPSWMKGFQLASPGVLFEGCVFVASGETYPFHESHLVAPSTTKRLFIVYHSAGTQSRLWTMRSCQFRVRHLPSGLPRSDVRAIEHQTMATAQSVELDEVRIDAAFADLPFLMGGITVRHRDVLHEGSGNPKPWSGAGAEVAL